MSTVLRSAGLGKKYRKRWALSDCTLEVPAGRVVGLVGPNGAGKSTFLNLAVGMITPTAGEIEVLGERPDRPVRAARPGRVRRPGHPDVRRAERRGPPPPRRAPQPRLGRRAGPGPGGAARPRPDPEGRPAVRRPALPARAHPRHRQAAGAAAARRAGRGPRPARPPGVPPGPDGGGRRAGAQRGAVLAPGLRRRARLRLPDRARRLPGAGRRRHRGPPRLATTDSPARAANPATLPGDQEVVTASHTDRQSTYVVRTDAPILDPAWEVSRLDPRGPGPRLHEPPAPPSAPAPDPRWRCSDDLAHLAAVPRLRRSPSSPRSRAVAVALAVTGPQLADLFTDGAGDDFFDRLGLDDAKKARLRLRHRARVRRAGSRRSVLGRADGRP